MCVSVCVHMAGNGNGAESLQFFSPRFQLMPLLGKGTIPPPLPSSLAGLHSCVKEPRHNPERARLSQALPSSGVRFGASSSRLTSAFEQESTAPVVGERRRHQRES